VKKGINPCGVGRVDSERTGHASSSSEGKIGTLINRRLILTSLFIIADATGAKHMGVIDKIKV
jgi:hypothetical protein